MSLRSVTARSALLAHRRRSILPCVAVAMLSLSACSSSSGSSGVTPFTLQPSSVTTFSFGKSPKELLYVSDSGTNEVDLLAWPKPNSITGALNGFSDPQGMCADTSGNVFITNTGDSNILEYTGNKLTSTLLDAGEYPVACSINPLDGDLAVANIFSTSDGEASVAIYKHASGKATIFAVKTLSRTYFVQYDGSGNLYASGPDDEYDPALVELQAGSKLFQPICTIQIRGGAFVPSSLGWDGKYLLTGDQESATVDRIKVCKVVGKTTLLGSSDIVDFTVVGNRLIGPDYGNADVEIYTYPKGGEPIQVIGGFSAPIGAAVSQNLKGK
jgi:hypothetical protein